MILRSGKRVGNSSWKTSVSKKSKPSSENELPISPFNPAEWISASKTRNYALSDTLVDWLNCYPAHPDVQCIMPRRAVSSSNNRQSVPDDSFLGFIMAKGLEFEANVISLLQKKFPNSIAVVYDQQHHFNLCSQISELEVETIRQMRKGTPLIYQAVLLNHKGTLNKTYGVADLLVRSDWLHLIAENVAISQDEISHPAPKIGLEYNHYVVVDIKFSTLQLCCDGSRIRNSGSVPAFKCQIYVYNHALGEIQGYEPPSAYILGRGCKYTKCALEYKEPSCFARLGQIAYDGWDSKYLVQTVDAVSWLRRIKTCGSKWNLLPKPSVNELYPNMTTPAGAWSDFKDRYARRIKELTLLWNCGQQNRETGLRAGITCYSDPECCAEALGFNPGKSARILDAMIDINREPITNIRECVRFHTNSEDSDDSENSNDLWINDAILQFTVDLEIITNVFDDFSALPNARQDAFLFMIGVSYTQNGSTPIHRTFLASELSIKAQFDIYHQFYLYLCKIRNQVLGVKAKIPVLYHWGHIEKSFFAGLATHLKWHLPSTSHPLIDKISSELEWFDISNVFRDKPIVINGCFGFGLKEIGTRLHELGLIKSNWSSDCDSGNRAMMLAHRVYSSTNSSKKDRERQLQPIVNYNRQDCIILQEIMQFMRESLK